MKNIPKTGPVLILANHISDLDPVMLQLMVPRHIYFMAKSELFEYKLVGSILRYWRAFPVRRGEADKGALKKAIDLLQQGEAVAIFPEGELSEDGNPIPLRPGVALIARFTQGPVVCVGLENTDRILPFSKLTPRPSFKTVWARCGTPIQGGKHLNADSFLAWATSQLKILSRRG